MAKINDLSKEIRRNTKGHISPFERIRCLNDSNNEYWESRDLAEVLEYTQYRNFEAVIAKAHFSALAAGESPAKYIFAKDVKDLFFNFI